MATSSKANAGPNLDIGANDLGPLAWVLDELRKSLDSATKALKRYVRDAELAKGSDLNAADASQLRIARQQLHQSVGALEMVGFNAPAAMLRGMEGAVQKFVTKPELCTDAAAAKVERASFALLGYLDALLVGKSPSAVELFSPYAEVQELAGATRIHPADLWAIPWRWATIGDNGAEKLELDANFRAKFDKTALMVVKTADLAACAELANLSAGLANQTALTADVNFSNFWRLAAGFFEAIATGSLVADLHVKRTVSRLLIQLATHIKGDLVPPDRLAQDLVFFCAQSEPKGNTPRLGEVRMAYGLAQYLPVDYTKSSFGQFDPTVLVQARKRISQLKESWSSFTAGELTKAKPVQDQMSLLVDSIQKLLPTTGQNLIAAINEVVDSTARIQRPPEPALGMEVATAILYLEASFEDFDPADKQLANRMTHLAQRVQLTRSGGESQPLESWMEELYRKVSDRQTMGSVVGELKLTLGELEKLMDAYFRDPQDKVLLADVPGKLAQMRGVLTVLGLDHAGQAVLRMRDSIEQILVTEINVEQVRAAGTFDKIGNNLGALGFLIDMLNYQPVLAKKMFVFDEAEGELKPLMGRTLAPEESEAPVAVVSTSDSSDQSASRASTPSAAVSAFAAAPAAASQPVIVDSEEVDPELLDIFLEEAREVATNGLAATQALVVEPNNLGEMTTLRRAYHTLKGSSRMVGLNVFGEAAWSMEQVMNAWLADQKPATPELCKLSALALQDLQAWIEEIATGGGKHRSSAPLRTSADAMRLNGQLLPIAAAPALAAVDAAVEPPASIQVAEVADALEAVVTFDPAPPVQTQASPSATIAPEIAVLSAALAVPALASVVTSSAADAPSTITLPATPPVEPAASLSIDDSIHFEFPTQEPAIQVPELDLTGFDLPEIAPLDLAPSANSTASVAPVEDFSLHLGDLDSSLDTKPVANLLEIEPLVTIATPVVVAEMASSLPNELTASQAEALFDFDLPSDDSSPATALPAHVLTADASSLAQAVIPAHEPAQELVQTQEPSAEELNALVTADELAAFEQAMMAMDAQGVEALDIASEASSTIDIHDLDALQALDSSLPAPASTAASEATMLAPAATVLQTWEPEPSPTAAAPELLTSDFIQGNHGASDFNSAATQPAPLDSLSAGSTDLGIDLHPASMGSDSLSPAMGIAVAGAAAFAAGAQLKADTAPSLLSSLSANPMSGMGALGADEQVKAIGPLRVNLPLYNVYLNEADEWSRRLCTCLAEWAMEAHASVPGDAIVFAHSLAGSSATVGFAALSGLARALEHALLHMQNLENNDEYKPHVHASLFVHSGEEIRHLLHQFAAGILKEASPEIEAGLARCLQEPIAQEQSNTLTPEVPQTTITSHELDHDIFLDVAVADEPALAAPLESPAQPITTSVEEKSEPAPVVVSAPPTLSIPESSAPLSSAQVAPLIAAGALAAAVVVAAPSASLHTLTEAPVLAVRSRQVGQDEINDEIDVEDALDPDLFEIFEEEAQEIFPATAAALRQWSARPDNMSARGEVLRGLHTLKGSARLAGALRLGEMAHRMESNVETIPHEGAKSSDIEALMGQLDGMQHTLEVLRNPALAEQATPPSANTASTVTASSAASTVSLASGAATGLSAASVTALRPAAAMSGAAVTPAAAMRSAPGQTVRVRAQLLDRLMNQAGEVMITRARLETELSQLRGSLSDLTTNLEKMRSQLRELDVQAESQMQTRIQQAKDTEEAFDPLEFDRYTRVQELTRMMAESVNDVATVHRNIQRSIESTEDDLIAQARQTRELQRDLLRTRMVEFEGISERLYRVVRQAGKDAGKQVKLDILGGTIEMDRGVLDRMTPAFEHLLRNCVAHGIEAAEARTAAGKAASGEIVITLHQEGNDVSIEFRDDGAGLNIPRIREKAIAQGLLGSDAALADNDAANLIFTPGFTTAAQVTELSGRGVGMDVVRSEVVALGGRIETATSAGKGTSFKLVLPLTTAVTQVVMVRIGEMSLGIPANLIEIVRRATQKELQQAYNAGSYEFGGESLPFFWAGALLQHSAASVEPATKTLPVMVFRSAAQRVALHIDEVLGNQEVVVKNLGPQLSRLPGLAGMTVLASGAVALIYNPVALATVYGAQARAMSFDPAQPHALESQSQMGALDPSITDAVPRELSGDAAPVVPFVPANPASISPPAVPLVLVVDDSITVRRVTQRLLLREGYRVSMAADGLQALEKLAEELPSVILSDIEMPRMDGFDFLRNVRGSAEYKHLPTIMITSRIAEKHREHAFELGANHYLGKPYNEEELLSLIRRYAREEATI